MRESFDSKTELCRVQSGQFATNAGDRFGAFFIHGPRGELLKIIASDGSDWSLIGMPLPAFEHVSVSLERRCPTWEEMAFAKSLFWNDDECVIQYHPPKSEHVNNHNYCLHLWKPIGVEIPLPPQMAVGVKSLGILVA